MLRQTINGQLLNTAKITGSDADLQTLATVLEGEVEIFSVKAEGGAEANGVVLNPIGFSVGKKKLTGSYLTTSIYLKHMKPTKSFSDISSAVKGVWDADFTSGIKSSYCNGYKATSQG